MGDMDYKRLFTEFSLSWFYAKPGLFAILNRFAFREDRRLVTCFRSGKGVIDYNPELLDKHTIGKIKAMLVLELSRILLCHPFRKRPAFCNEELWYEASTMAICPTYAAKKGFPSYRNIEDYYMLLLQAENQSLPRLSGDDDTSSGDGSGAGSSIDGNAAGSLQPGSGDMSGSLQPGSGAESAGGSTSAAGLSGSGSGGGAAAIAEGSGSGGGAGSRTAESVYEAIEDEASGMLGFSDSELKADNRQDFLLSSPAPEQGESEDADIPDGAFFPTGLWEEDDVEEEQIQQIALDCIEEFSGPGPLPGALQYYLELQKDASFQTSIDIINYFSTQITRSRRCLTRMKPNRRTGFAQMGSRYKPKPEQILVGVDTSGSITDEQLESYYAIIRKLNRKIRHVYVFQTDAALKTPKPVLFRPGHQISVKGRGGTDFQAFFTYAYKNQRDYDGVVVFSDGIFNPVKIQKGFKPKVLWVLNYDSQIQDWMLRIGRCTYIQKEGNVEYAAR